MGRKTPNLIVANKIYVFSFLNKIGECRRCRSNWFDQELPGVPLGGCLRGSKVLAAKLLDLLTRLRVLNE